MSTPEPEFKSELSKLLEAAPTTTEEEGTPSEPTLERKSLVTTNDSDINLKRLEFYTKLGMEFPEDQVAKCLGKSRTLSEPPPVAPSAWDIPQPQRFSSEEQSQATSWARFSPINEQARDLPPHLIAQQEALAAASAGDPMTYKTAHTLGLLTK